MKKLFPHLFICLFVYLFICLILPPRPVYAATQDWPVMDYPLCREKTIPTGAVCAPSYFFGGLNWQESGYVEQILGAVPGVTVTLDAYQRNPTIVQYMNQRSTISSVSNYIAMIYTNPPASTALALQDIGQSLGFIPRPVYAQGTGFTGLSPLLGIWRIFRNISYVLLAVVMLVVGFMVMLRKKIDPKTVVTVQNAIPRIVMALLLITFSYAIVGFLIDIMYLSILLASTLLDSADLLPQPSVFDRAFGLSTIQDVFARGGLNAIFNYIFPWGVFSIGDLASDVIGWNVATSFGVGTAGLIIGGLISGPGALVGAAAGAFGVPVLITFLLALVILYGFIRLFIMFLSAYIQIVFATIAGPIQLALVAMPGTDAFGNWLKNLIVNLLTFPIAGIMFMLAGAFASAADQAGVGRVWNPPYLGMNMGLRNFEALFSLGVLMAIPTVVNSVKEAIKAKPAIPVGAGAITAPISAVYGTTLTQISQLYYLQQLTREATGGKGLLQLLGFKPKQ